MSGIAAALAKALNNTVTRFRLAFAEASKRTESRTSTQAPSTITTGGKEATLRAGLLDRVA